MAEENKNENPLKNIPNKLAFSKLYTEEEIEALKKKYKGYRGITKQQFTLAIQQYMRAFYTTAWTFDECETAIDIVSGTIQCLLAQGETVYLPGLCKFTFKYNKPNPNRVNNIPKLKCAKTLLKNGEEYDYEYEEMCSKDVTNSNGSFTPTVKVLRKKGSNLDKLMPKDIIPVGFESDFNDRYYAELEAEFGKE